MYFRCKVQLYVYIYTHTHICLYIYRHKHIDLLFFKFFSHSGYQGILSRVPCDIQQVLGQLSILNIAVCTSILLRIFAYILIRDIDLQFSFFVMSYLVLLSCLIWFCTVSLGVFVPLLYFGIEKGRNFQLSIMFDRILL